MLSEEPCNCTSSRITFPKPNPIHSYSSPSPGAVCIALVVFKMLPFALEQQASGWTSSCCTATRMGTSAGTTGATLTDTADTENTAAIPVPPAGAEHRSMQQDWVTAGLCLHCPLLKDALCCQHSSSDGQSHQITPPAVAAGAETGTQGFDTRKAISLLSTAAGRTKGHLKSLLNHCSVSTA